MATALIYDIRVQCGLNSEQDQEIAGCAAVPPKTSTLVLLLTSGCGQMDNIVISLRKVIKQLREYLASSRYLSCLLSHGDCTYLIIDLILSIPTRQIGYHDLSISVSFEAIKKLGQVVPFRKWKESLLPGHWGHWYAKNRARTLGLKDAMEMKTMFLWNKSELVEDAIWSAPTYVIGRMKLGVKPTQGFLIMNNPFPNVWSISTCKLIGVVTVIIVKSGCILKFGTIDHRVRLQL